MTGIGNEKRPCIDRPDQHPVNTKSEADRSRRFSKALDSVSAVLPYSLSPKSATSPLVRNASYNCAGPSSTSFSPLRTFSDSRACLLMVE